SSSTSFYTLSLHDALPICFWERRASRNVREGQKGLGNRTWPHAKNATRSSSMARNVLTVRRAWLPVAPKTRCLWAKAGTGSTRRSEEPRLNSSHDQISYAV